MASDLQVLWGCHLYDILRVTKSSRDLSDENIRNMLDKYKEKILKIKELDLSCLPIKSIAVEIKAFESLEVLNISNCALEGSLSPLKSLNLLKSVNFSANKLNDLEVVAESLNVKNLNSLDLSKNAFSTFPELFIQKLDASENGLPLHINLSDNIWLEDDEFLQNLSIVNNWVLQIGDKFF